MHASRFHDLESYIALPRVGSLAVSADGRRAVVGVGVLDQKKTAWVTHLWLVDVAADEPAVRLTRGAKGESVAAWTPTGDLLFLAKRPDAEGDEDAPAALWLLPRVGGEARIVATHPGGFGSVRVAGDVVVLTASVMPGATTVEADTALRKLRKEKKVAAILHSSYPVRHWDADLGPDEARLYAASLADLAPGAAGEPEPRLALRDLTPDAGACLRSADVELAPDGSFVVTTWYAFEARARRRQLLMRIDTATGERTVLRDEPGTYLYGPALSPDGNRLVWVRDPLPTAEHIDDPTLWVADLAGGEARQLAPGWDRWAHRPRWLPDGSGVVVAADDEGHGPLFRVPLDGTPPVRLTTSGTYTDHHVTLDGRVVALRTSYEAPPEPVRVEPDGTVVALQGPAGRPALPGTLAEVATAAADGVRVRGWLCLPEGASPDAPAPLVLWIHGGPLNSWNAWSWRWCPWLLVAQGYAVLLPDPALSTGYGNAFVNRGWGRWGEAPYTDLMAITDAVVDRPDIDATRTAAMGGSFGGYMANWVAGHTDRFDAIVTHASLWALDQFGPTTDHAEFWAHEMTPAMAVANSPHRFVAEIRTPMLVIHGDRDYRVPIGEGLRLWYELLSASGLPMGDDGTTVHRFLYFPDENHWILSPQHAVVWYQVVSNFLAEHVLGRPAPAHPEALGLAVADAAASG